MPSSRLTAAAFLATFASLPLPLAASQTRLYEVARRTPSTSWNRDVVLIGDANGDSVSDFALIEGADVDVYSGATGTLFRTIPTWQGARLGRLAAAGDVDRDGRADLVISANDGFLTDFVIVLSGRTGATIWSIKGSNGFGQAVAGGGDADGDGYPDFLATTRGLANVGSVDIYSGKTGQRLGGVSGTPWQYFGLQVAFAGDVDADGFDDVMVATTDSVQVFSGASSRQLLNLQGQAHEGFGTCLGSLGDFDGDGHADLYIGAPYGPRVSTTEGPGYVTLVSGKTGSVIRRVYGAQTHDVFGTSFTLVGDVDRDGKEDYAVGAPQSFSWWAIGKGYVRVLSGRYGTDLVTIEGSTYGDAFGAMVTAGDANLDGTPDLLVYAPQIANAWRTGPGFMSAQSTRSLPLAADAHTFSASRGGAQRLAFRGGSGHGWQPYLVLGSMTGTRPGLRIGSVTVPLNFDSYTELTVFGLWQHILRGQGTLDAAGASDAVFYLSGLPRDLIGLTLHHAVVVLDAAGPRFASNAVPLTVVP